MSRTISDYTFNSNECLGQGTLGNLHKGINKKTNQEVVLRLLQKSLLKDDKIMATALTEEMTIMQKIKHPKINPILDVVESQNYFYVVFPFCSSNLQQILKKQKRLSEQETIKLINDLTDGFSELVKSGIIHRDLKPSNILFEKNQYILSDPGFAKTLENFRKDTKTKPHNFAYVAPQVLETKQKYTNKCDIWSLGMILYECVMGVLPFYAQNIDEHLKLCRSKKIEIPQNVVSADMKSFIEGCLIYQENKRLEWSQVLSHPLINQKLKEKTQDVVKSNKKYLMTQIRQKIIKKNLDFEEIYNDMDTNKNGSLDFDEFSAFVVKIDKKLTKEDSYYVFQQIDKDGSGFISLDEFKQWLSGNNTKMAVFKIKQNNNKKQDSFRDNLQNKNTQPNYQAPGYQIPQQPQYPPQQQQQLNQYQYVPQIPPQLPQQQQQRYQPQQPQPQLLPQQYPPPQLMLSSSAVPNGAGYGKSDKLEKTILQLKQQIKTRQIDVLAFFQQYDLDRDNFLSFQEFSQLIWNLNPQLKIEEMADLFKVFNLNNDEMVSFVEFRLVTNMANEKKQAIQNYPQQPNMNFPFQQPTQNPQFPNIPQQNPQQPFYGNIPQFPQQAPQVPQVPQQYPIPYNAGQKQDQSPNQYYKQPVQGGVLTNNNNNKKSGQLNNSQLDAIAKQSKKEKKKERDREREKEREREREREKEREKEREREKRQQSRSRSPENKKKNREDSPPPLRPPKLNSMDYNHPVEPPKQYKSPKHESNQAIIKPSPRNEKQKTEQPTVTYQLPKEHNQHDMFKSISPLQSVKYLPEQMTFTVGSRYDHELTESTHMMHTSVIPANFNNRPYRKVLDEKIDTYYYSRR